MHSVDTRHIQSKLGQLAKRRGLLLAGALIFVFAFVLLLSASNASAAGPTYAWQNVDSGSNHWTAAGSPYIVNKTIAVPAGVTLTIDANVTVRIDPGAQITVNGSLVANGEAARMVTFTKNNTLTKWNGIVGNDNSRISLNYANVDNDTQLTVHNTGIFTNTRFSNPLFNAIYFQILSKDGNLTVTNCNFTTPLNGIIDVSGFITVTSNASNVKTFNVPISITNNYFGPGFSASAIVIGEYVASHDNAVVTLNSNAAINGNRFNIGVRTGIVFTHFLDPYDNSTSQINGDITINTNRFNSGPAIGYGDVINVHNLASPLMAHNNLGRVTGNVRIANNDLRSVTICGIGASAQITSYGEKASIINVPVTITGNNITSTGDGIMVSKQSNAYENSTASISGAVTIDSNRIYQAVNGAYISSSAIAAASSRASVMIDTDLSFTNNVMTTITGRGLYVYDRMNAAGTKSSSFSSAVTVTGNSVWQESAAMIEIDRAGLNSFNNSTLNINGAITLRDNTATVSHDMILVNVYYLAQDKSSIFAAGDVLIAGNQAQDTSSTGIGMYFTTEGRNSANVTTNSDIEVTDNSVEVADSYGMHVERNLIVRGNSTGTLTGIVDIQRNSLLEENYQAFYALSYVGAFDNSKGSLFGDFTVSNNTVKVYDDSAFSVKISAYAEVKLVGKASTAAITGRTLIADNHADLSKATTTDKQFYIWYKAEGFANVTGSSMGSKWANASVGDIQVLRNIVTLDGHGAMGIQYDPDIYADATNGGSASATAGRQTIADNVVTGVGDSFQAFNLWGDYLWANSNLGNATVQLGSIVFTDNLANIKGNNSVAFFFDHQYDVFAHAKSKWLASFQIAGGINIVGTTVSMVGYGNSGINVTNLARTTYARADSLNARAVLDMPLSIADNAITMSGANCRGVVVSGYALYARYWDGSVTFDAGLSVMNNNVKLDSGLGEAIQVSAPFRLDSTSFNGHATVDSRVSVSNNVVNRGLTGIHIMGSGDAPVYVSGNKVTGTYGSALSVENSNAVIENNVLSENQGNGITLNNSGSVTHIVIGNNTIDHNANRGLYIVGSSSVMMYNGLFRDNIDYGIYVPAGSQVKWVIDAASSVKDNKVAFFGNIEVKPAGTLTLDSVSDFNVGAADSGVTLLTVDLGGSLVIQNSKIQSDNGAGLFLVYGSLTMTSSTESGWSEIYLANGSSAQITSSTISNNDRNGVYIGGSHVTISSCTITSNGMDGVFMDSGSQASIKGCLILSNERGVYARNSTLDNVVDNIFAMNTVAGVYTEGAVGKIHANIFLMDKNEIFVLNSVVSIEDNEIGYAHIVDQMARYSTLVSLITNMAMEVNSGSLSSSTSLSSVLPMDTSDLASMLFGHIGVYAVNSNVEAKGNTYGLLSYAMYAENSTVSFGDTVQSNTIVIQWLNSNLDAKNITIPTFVYNGVYLINSKLTMSGASIQCMNDAVFLDDSSATITGSALNASRFDVYTVHKSDVSMSKTTLDGKLKVEDNGTLTWLNQFTVIVKDADGNLVKGASVTITDGNGRIIASGNTSSNGQFVADVTGWTQTSGGKQSVSAPYWVNATVNGKSIAQTADGSQSRTITAQATGGVIPAILLPLLLIAALVIAIMVIAVVVRARKKSA